MIKELDKELTSAVRKICKNNPPAAQPAPKDTMARLIYKRVFGYFMQSTHMHIYMYMISKHIICMTVWPVWSATIHVAGK